MKRSILSVIWSCLLLASPALCGNQTDGGETAVPEPGSLILLGTAAVGIGFAAWRKTRKRAQQLGCIGAEK